MAIRNYSSTSPIATLTAGVGAGDVSVTLSQPGTQFPAAPFTMILDPDTVNEEVVDVTAVTGSVFTITRAVDGTTAKAHSFGARAIHGVSGRDFQESVSSDDITRMVVATQDEYDALTPNPTTFYVVVN